MIVPDPSDLPDLVRDLHHEGTPWLPAGLASRLDWGAPLRQPCTVVSAAKLRGILEHNPGDFTITVAAGTPLVELQEALALHRQWLAVDPPPIPPAPDSAAGAESESRGQGSIGGLVARGLAGGYRQRYLGVRDQLIGIRILRSDGVAANAGGKVVKNVAGYDLMRLFAGSWGSLGLITAVTLRTMPLPQHRAGLLLRGPLETLVEQVGVLLRSGLSPERIDLWSSTLAAASGLGAEPVLLLGLASVNAACLKEQLDGLASAPEIRRQRCQSGELEALLAAARLPAQPAANRPQDGPSAGALAAGVGGSDPAAWLLRLGVTPTRIGELLKLEELADLPVDLAAGSGLGMAWGTATALSPARVEALRRHCRALGGHLAVLRQPPATDPGSTSPIPAWEDAPSRALIELVKARFDPKLQLAPGRLPGVARPAIGAVGVFGT